VSAILERMIARVRAPLSPVEPVFPPRYAPPAWASGPDEAPAWASGRDEVPAWVSGPDEVAPAATAADRVAAAGPEDVDAPDAPAERLDAAAHDSDRPAAPRANVMPRVRAVVAPEPMPDVASASADATSGVLRQDPAVPSPAFPPSDEPQASRRPVPGERSTIDRGDRAPQPIQVRVAAEVRPEPLADREPAVPTPPWPRDEAGASVPRTERPHEQAPREPSPPASSPSPQGASTEVHISIGHIEVRSAPRAAAPRKPAPRPRVTLDEYLRRRNGGTR